MVARRLLKRVTQFGAVLRERLGNSENNQDVSLLDAEQTKEEGSSPPDHDAIADQFINVLLNVDHDMQKFMIIKLVSNIDTRRSVEEVLSTIPIITQATYNKSAVNREECTPQYAVDQHAFWNHTRGKTEVYLVIVIQVYAPLESTWHYFEQRKKFSSLSLVLAQ